MARSCGRRKEIAAKDGLDIQVVVFNDYLLPNAALDVGDLDANAFQHKPFLENQIKTRGYKVTSVGETIVAPIGLYSRRAKSVADIGDGASIGIPNDPSNGGRALLLLQAQNLIKSRMALAGCPPSSNCRQSEEVATARNRWGPASAQSGRSRCHGDQYQLRFLGRTDSGQGLCRYRIPRQQSPTISSLSVTATRMLLGAQAGACLSE
jgi:hypothetical protein